MYQVEEIFHSCFKKKTSDFWDFYVGIHQNKKCIFLLILFLGS